MSDGTPVSVPGIAPPPEPVQPITWLGDRAYTPSSAEERMAALNQDPAFQERVSKNDATAFAEYNQLWRIQHGLPVEPRSATSAIDVMTETIGRELVDAQRRADSLRSDGFSEDGIYQVLNGRPILADEKRFHQQELDRLKRDNAWVQKYMDGDKEARLQMRRRTAAITMPAGTLEQIRAWEAAHGRPAS